MLDQKKKARLNEVGKEIAGMCPKDNGSVTFDYGMGRLKGVRFDAKWRPEIDTNEAKYAYNL